MKKLITGIAAMVMCASMAMTSYATTIATAGGTASQEVQGTYTPSKTAVVYRVDVTWGSLSFDYNEGSEGTWNPATHTYGSATNAEWTWVEGSNSVKIDNHSNSQVTAAVSFNSSIEGLKGTFYTTSTTGGTTTSQVILDSAAAVALGNFNQADTETVYLRMAGAGIKETGTIGSVTVVLQ